MDLEVISLMVFTLLFALIVAGVVLLYPVSRRLGLFLESRVQERAGLPGKLEADLRSLGGVVENLDAQLRSLTERQEFLERILDARRRPELLAVPEAVGRPPV